MLAVTDTPEAGYFPIMSKRDPPQWRNDTLKALVEVQGMATLASSVGGPIDGSLVCDTTVPLITVHPSPDGTTGGTPVTLGFPLSTDMYQALSELAVPSPFGVGPDTVLDPAVRSSVEVEGSRVSFSHPLAVFSELSAGSASDDTPADAPTDVLSTGWDDGTVFGPLLENAHKQMGMPGTGLRAELHKLVLYGPGAHFSTHVDSEKGDGMVGTLVILLPSHYTGGELRVSNVGTGALTSPECVYGSSPGLSYALFYADAPHEVFPVKAGLRVSLLYNVYAIDVPNSESETGAQAGLVPRTSDARVAKTIAKLNKTTSKPDWGTGVIFDLDHRYTPSGATHAHWKGSDAVVVAVLLEWYAQRSPDAEPFSIFAMSLQVDNEVESFDHEMVCPIRLDTWVTVDFVYPIAGEAPKAKSVETYLVEKSKEGETGPRSSRGVHLVCNGLLCGGWAFSLRKGAFSETIYGTGNEGVRRLRQLRHTAIVVCRSDAFNQEAAASSSA